MGTTDGLPTSAYASMRTSEPRMRQKFERPMAQRLPGTLLLSALGLLAGCNDDLPPSPDQVQVIASVGGTVSAAVGSSGRSVSLVFNTTDGRDAHNLSVTTNLSALPSGWHASPNPFKCASVATGNGCLLGLTFAPGAVVSGTLDISYTYTNNAGSALSGTWTIPYTATVSDNVVATASPSGQVNAVVGAAAQVINVSFTTDDGNLAAGLSVTTNLGALPAGWSSGAAAFTCGKVSTGNGCQLALRFAPTTQVHGTLTLAYSYTDNAGTAKSGSLNIPYAATEHDHVVATASPAGQVNAVAGAGSTPVLVTFTTDDGQAAAGLTVTTALNALPAGWSSQAHAFYCATVSTGSTCQLALAYAPATVGGGTLTLAYTYTDNAGTAKTGTANIAYAATSHDSVVATVSPSGQVTAAIGGTTPATVTFTTDDGNPATALTVTGGLGSLPSGWSSTGSSFTCATLSTGSACQLALSYQPTGAGSGTVTLTYGYDDDSGVAKTGSVDIPYAVAQQRLYVANIFSTLDVCTLASDGSLSSCAATGASGAAPTGIAFYGSVAYVTDFYNGAVDVCTANSDGTITNCSAVSGFLYPWALAVNGGYLYVTSATTSGSTTYCEIGSGGSLSNCTATAAGLSLANGIALGGGYAYLTALNGSTYELDKCIDNLDGTLSGCTATGSGFSSPQFITLSGGYAYIGNQQNSAVAVCTIAVGGDLTNCTDFAMGYRPNGVAIYQGHAYVSDDNDNIYFCTVGAGGTLSNCTPSNGGATFSAPQQLAVH